MVGTNQKLEIDRLKFKLLVIILNQNGSSVAVKNKYYQFGFLKYLNYTHLKIDIWKTEIKKLKEDLPWKQPKENQCSHVNIKYNRF